MAEKAEKKPDEKGAAAAAPAAGHGANAEAAAKAKGGLLKSTPLLLGVVMLIEAVILFAGFKMLGGGAKHADASITTGEEGAKDEHGGGGHADGHGDGHGGAPAGIDKKKLFEIPVLEFKAPNTTDGKRWIYDVAILARVKGESKDKVEGLIKDSGATIKDRVRTIIAQMNPEKLGGGTEPGLETLKRQVKFQLDEILGDGLVEEVVVPRCIGYRQD